MVDGAAPSDLSARGQRLSKDVRNAEWARLAPVIPRRRRVGDRARPTCGRDDAVFYLLRTGCPWRYLPPRQLSAPLDPPTTSFASSNVMASGRRSGRAAYGAARAMGGRPAPRLKVCKPDVEGTIAGTRATTMMRRLRTFVPSQQAHPSF